MLQLLNASFEAGFKPFPLHALYSFGILFFNRLNFKIRDVENDVSKDCSIGSDICTFDMNGKCALVTQSSCIGNFVCNMLCTNIQLLRWQQTTEVQGLIRVVGGDWYLPRHCCI